MELSEFAQAKHARLMKGFKGTGKTTHLLQELKVLLEAGADASDIMIICATPDAASAFASRAEEMGFSIPPMATITTARDYALRILDTPHAFEATGRHGRLVQSYEEPFIIEDMKTSGLKPDRLKGMLDFMRRGWTEMSDEDEKWLIDNEERDVQQYFRDYLGAYAAVEEAEAANLALKFLRLYPEEAAAWQKGTVLVDDYLAQNRSSQLLANFCCCNTLLVAADPANVAAVFDSYPYAQGLDDLATMYPALETTVLSTCQRSVQSAAIGAALLKDKEITSLFARASQDNNAVPTYNAQTYSAQPDGTAEEATWQRFSLEAPKDEFSAAAQWAKSMLDEGIASEKIFIVHPSVPAWGSNVAKQLTTSGIPCHVAPHYPWLKSDIRKVDKTRTLALLTLTSLYRNRHDGFSWRCWLGFGNWLASSASVRQLVHYATLNSMTFEEVLALSVEHELNFTFVSEEELGAAANSAALTKIFVQTGSVLDEASQLFGENATDENLIAFLSAKMTELFGYPQDADDTDVAKVCGYLSEQNATEGEGIVIGPWSVLTGASADAVLFVGMVNGFFPDIRYFDLTAITIEKQARMRTKWVREAYAALPSANRFVAFSGFRYVDAKSAQTLRLKVARIGLRDKIPVATIEPSEVLSLIE